MPVSVGTGFEARSTTSLRDDRKDFLPLRRIDHVEFYVGNARQAAYFYRAAFGFRLAAYRGPDTGDRDRASYVLQQGNIRFVLTTPLRACGGVADHIFRHGDGVRSIALEVDSAAEAWSEATRRGAIGLIEPETHRDEHGQVIAGSIALYGDTIHTFIERGGYHGAFLPGFVAAGGPDEAARPVGLREIDFSQAINGRRRGPRGPNPRSRVQSRSYSLKQTWTYTWTTWTSWT